MMALINVFLQGFLVIYFAEITVGSEGCNESPLTVRRINECPKTKEEWNKASSMKQCYNISHSCSSFIYHCVMNVWRNETVEVCVPRTNIVGHVCPEYNTGGQRVQLSKKQCTECPVSYSSSESYKYQECYDYSQLKNQAIKLQPSIGFLKDDITPHSQFGFVLVVVMCSMFIILLFTVLLYIKRSKISCIKNYGSSVYENYTENLLTDDKPQIASARSTSCNI